MRSNTHSTRLPSLLSLATALAMCNGGCGTSNSDSSTGAGGSTRSSESTSSGGASASSGSGGAAGTSASSRSSALGGSTGPGGSKGSSSALAGGGASAAQSGSTTTGGSTGGSTGTGGKSTGTGNAGSGGQAGATGGSTLRDGSAAAGATTGDTGGGPGGTSSTGTGSGGTGGSSGTSASGKGPCDIYEAASTPCVAAHSTTRALYAAYNGKLYQVRRADKALQDIGLLSPGGIADAAAQETFCANSKCTISRIYDQSPKKNDLTLTSGGWIADRAKESDAFGIKIKLGGKTVYGIHITGETNMTGNGYRNNQAVGTAEGDQPESMYMVANGKNYNDKCCFDYGNAERNSLNNGPATMEAIYFGNCTAWGRGDGSGPWVMADLEEGLFTGKNKGLNAGAQSLSFYYLTAMLKGKPHTMAIKAGDSQTGKLTTVYEGAYPTGYDPMKKEGAIVLGTGGDNSFAATGDFFEGAMTATYTTDETDEAVQTNIVAAGYGR